MKHGMLNAYIDSPLKRERPHDVYFKYNEARV